MPALLFTPFTARADDLVPESQFVPPPYKVLRFDEDYSRVNHPTNHTDAFDPIKYVPLRTNDPAWYLTLGGELRERFEGNYNPNFGIGGQKPDSYWLQRVTLLSDVHLGDRFRFYAEGISGVMEGEHPPAPPVQQDPIDLQYAFADFVPYLTDDESLTLRGGRFGMSFGSGRLVATRAAPNIPFRFDGGEMIYTRPRWEATAFLTRPKTMAEFPAVILAPGFGGCMSLTGLTRRGTWALTFTIWASPINTRPTLRGLAMRTVIRLERGFLVQETTGIGMARASFRSETLAMSPFWLGRRPWIPVTLGRQPGSHGSV